MVAVNDTSCNLLRNASNIRNICIMAHVDHGKTSLADSLIASNGIISPRLAGKLRYMDSRKDEQERGITMKSSSISLLYKKDNDEYLINVIDSPGHVDFSAEVSTAVRLCDGALIVIDVVEGVCPQTRVALQHAWAEKVKPLLVLNKVDRLILEMKMSPLDAYVQLTQILEQVNSVTGDLFRSEVLGKTDDLKRSVNGDTYSDWSSGLEEADDSNVYFSPAEGNVVFASAIDGWGFTIDNFAEILSKKLGFSKNVLCKTLWGNYYLNSKMKRVMKGAQENAKKPLFVQLILENIWLFYDTIVTKKDKEKTASMIENLHIDLKPQQLRFSDVSSVVRTVFGRWIPLAAAVLESICTRLPAPNRLSDEKIDNLVTTSKFSKPCDETLALKAWFERCESSDEAPVIVFISKMFPVEREHLPENRIKPLTLEEINARREQAKQRLLAKEISDEPVEDANEEIKQEDDQVFVAFARVYSGCLRPGIEVYVLGPKHDPRAALQRIRNGYHIESGRKLKDLKADEHITKVRVDRLYLLMGRELEPLNEAFAGNVLGIGGLEEHVLKSATLSTEIACPAFRELHFMATPIMRVAVEPENPSHLAQVTRGLKLLNQADASVQVLVQETGEQVLVTAGEVHLQRCIEDLRERYAKVPVLVSEPIIPFRETIVPPPTVDMVNEMIKDRGRKQTNKTAVTVHTADNLCTLEIKAVPLPSSVIKFLENNADLIKFLTSLSVNETEGLAQPMEGSITSTFKFRHLDGETAKVVSNFRTELKVAFKSDSTLDVDKIWSFGPKLCGLNILFKEIDDERISMSFWNTATEENEYTKYESNLINGFQLATLAGPLCEEPMMGVGFVVSRWSISEEVSHGVSSPYGPLSGQLICTMKEGCRKAFQTQPQRLVAAMYSCNMQVNSEVLGRMYSLLNKRHGRILHGDLAVGSGATFEVTAFLPVAESFQFASEVRKQSSGLANPQLVFSHWEVIDLDPFWTPNTEEEYLLYGEKADSENYARIYMNKVRRRKGLPTDEKIVEHAEKQRTLSKNK